MNENISNKEKLYSLYLLYGEERFLLENMLSKIKKNFGKKVNGINYINLDSTNIDNIISDIQTPAFGYPKKMVIVKDSGLFKKIVKNKKGTVVKTTIAEKTIKKEKDKCSSKSEDENKLENKIAIYIEENIDYINEALVIVFVEDDVDKNSLYKEIEKRGKIQEFERLKLPDIIKKLKSICNAYNVNIDDATTRYFVEVCGTNMQDLINEIRKQIEFAGVNGTITTSSIDTLATKQLDSIIFDLTDNLGKRNIHKALEVLANLRYTREPIQKILITLYGHFKKIYLTKIAIEENRNISECLNLKPAQMFLMSKYTMQAKYFKKQELRDILQELINIDYNSKNGNIDADVGLEAILCKYCS